MRGIKFMQRIKRLLGLSTMERIKIPSRSQTGKSSGSENWHGTSYLQDLGAKLEKAADPKTPYGTSYLQHPGEDRK